MITSFYLILFNLNLIRNSISILTGEVGSTETLASCGPIIVDWFCKEIELKSDNPELKGISETWAMPNRHTFKIKPIKALIDRYFDPSKLWIDPFAGENSPAIETNDINPEKPTKYHLDAEDFVKKYGAIDGVLFDPPYSPRQVKEVYESAGLEIIQKDTQGYGRVKDAIAERTVLGALVISCGWSGNGMGQSRGFERVETLLVVHGGAHNATVVVVEKKVRL